MLLVVALAGLGMVEGQSYWLGSASSGGEISGRPSVMDGDSLEVHGTQVRLHGIDAPESDQPCTDERGQPYPCGRRAAFALTDRIGSGVVSCEQRDIDRYGRVVAVCRAGGEDLNEWMVEQGWAVAYRRYSREYIGAEEEARAADRGIWAGSFHRAREMA